MSITLRTRPNFINTPLMVILMYCPFTVCCHWQVYSKLFELIGCLSDWLRLSCLAKPSPVIFLYWLLSLYYHLYILLNGSFPLLYFCLVANIYIQLLTIHPYNFSKCNLQPSNIKNLWTCFDTFGTKFSYFADSFSFPVHQPSPTCFQHVSLTSVLSKIILEYVVQYIAPTALGFPQSWCDCVAI